MDTQQESPRNQRVLRLREVETRTGLRRATLYRRAKEGTFPKPIRLGGNSSGWIESEVDAWLNERITERDTQAAQ